MWGHGGETALGSVHRRELCCRTSVPPCKARKHLAAAAVSRVSATAGYVIPRHSSPCCRRKTNVFNAVTYASVAEKRGATRPVAACGVLDSIMSSQTRDTTAV